MPTQKHTEETRTIVIEKTTFLNDGEKQHVSGEEMPTSGLVNIQPGLEHTFKLRNSLIRELIAELFGIFLLCLIGLSSVAQFVLNKDSTRHSFLSVNLGFGIGVTVSILVVGKVSGCHINPAVSLAMFLTGRLTLLRLALYTLVQILGAFLAAALVFALYYDAFAALHRNIYVLDTAGRTQQLSWFH